MAASTPSPAAGSKSPHDQAAQGIANRLFDSPESKRARLDENVEETEVERTTPSHVAQVPGTEPSLHHASVQGGNQDLAQLLLAQQQNMVVMMQSMQQSVAMIAQIAANLNHPQVKSEPSEGAINTMVQAVNTLASCAKPKEKIPAPLMKQMDSVGASFEKEVRKHVRSIDRVKHMRELCEFFEKDETQERYPAGVRPFKSPMEQAELDLTWSKAQHESVKINVEVRKGSTMREALQKLHWNFAKMSKHIELEAAMQHQDDMKLRVTKTALAESLKHIVDEAATKKFEDMGLEEPLKAPISAEFMHSKTEELYSKALEKINGEREKLEKKKLEDKKKKEEAEEALLKQKPQDLLQAVVETAVNDAIAAKTSEEKTLEYEQGIANIAMQEEVEEREENEKEKRVLSLVEALKSNPKMGSPLVEARGRIYQQ